MMFERLQGLWDFPILTRLRPPVLTWNDVVTNVTGNPPNLDSNRFNISKDMKPFAFTPKEDIQARVEYWGYGGKRGEETGTLKKGWRFNITQAHVDTYKHYEEQSPGSHYNEVWFVEKTMSPAFR